MTTYEARVAARAAGIPLRCLLGWCERRVIQPTIVAQGRGTRRLFTRRDLLMLRALATVHRIVGTHAGLGVIARMLAAAIKDRRTGIVRIERDAITLYVNLTLLGRQVDAELR